MANIIEAIANASGQTAEMVKDYMHGVARDVNERMDLMPTYDELKRMAHYKLVGNRDDNGNVDVSTTSGKYHVFVRQGGSPSVVIRYTDNTTGSMPFPFLITLNRSQYDLGFFTFELIGFDDNDLSMLHYAINGERHTVKGDIANDRSFHSMTFGDVDSVYSFTPGAEVIARDGVSAFIRYSAHADGTDFTDTWSEGQYYIGIATAMEAPTDKTGYKWSLLGAKGWDDVSTALDKIIKIQKDIINGIHGNAKNLFDISKLTDFEWPEYASIDVQEDEAKIRVDCNSALGQTSATHQSACLMNLCDDLVDGEIYTISYKSAYGGKIVIGGDLWRSPDGVFSYTGGGFEISSTGTTVEMDALLRGDLITFICGDDDGTDARDVFSEIMVFKG